MRFSFKIKSASIPVDDKCRFVDSSLSSGVNVTLASVDEKVQVARTPSRTLRRPRPAHITSSIVQVMPEGDMYLINDNDSCNDEKRRAGASTRPSMYHQPYAYNDIYEQIPPSSFAACDLQPPQRVESASLRPNWISRSPQRTFNDQPSISIQPQLAPSGGSIRSILTSTSYSSSMRTVPSHRVRGEARSVKFCEVPVVHAGRKNSSDEDSYLSPGGSTIDSAYDSDDSGLPFMSRKHRSKRKMRMKNNSAKTNHRTHTHTQGHSEPSSSPVEKKDNLFARAAQWVRRKLQSTPSVSAREHDEDDSGSRSTRPKISGPYPLSRGASHARSRKQSKSKASTGSTLRAMWIRVTCV